MPIELAHLWLLGALALAVFLLLLIAGSITWGMHISNQNFRQELGWMTADLADLRESHDDMRKTIQEIQGPIRYPQYRTTKFSKLA